MIILFKFLLYVCLLSLFISPILLIVQNRFYKTKPWPSWHTFVISVVLVWVLVQVGVELTNATLNLELYAFDLDGNGMFMGEEINVQQNDAMQRVTADTGRAFAPITGAIAAVVYVTALMTIVGFFDLCLDHKND